MKTVLLLALLTVAEGNSYTVHGQTGQNVTLTCKYNIKKHGQLWACWGRGEIPQSGCNNQLIYTDGQAVKEGTSIRYQLLGHLDEGDVSMTILNVTGSDAGLYGCRVEIPGWFNDHKHRFNLVIETAAQTTTSTTPDRVTSTEQTVSHTAGHLTTTESLPTSSSSSNKAEENSMVTVLLVCFLFGVISLVTVGGLIIITRRWRQLNKIPQQQVISPVQFSSTSSRLHLHSRGSAVENVYQIDGDVGSGGEYEYCP